MIYREIFGNPTSTTDTLSTAYGWQQFNATGVAITTNTINRMTNGRTTDVANVNAGLNPDGTSGAYALGLQYMNSATNLAITTEYSVNIADYQPGSLQFSLYLGNASTASTQRVVVRIGSDWYASNTTLSMTTAGITLANFSTQAQLKTLTFDPTASSWSTINFNGNYVVGGSATNSTAGTMSLGASPGSDLTGTITAFGLYSVVSGGNSRFDTFTISGIAVPEPAWAQVFLVGGLGLLVFKFHRRQRIS